MPGDTLRKRERERERERSQIKRFFFLREKGVALAGIQDKFLECGGAAASHERANERRGAASFRDIENGWTGKRERKRERVGKRNATGIK